MDDLAERDPLTSAALGRRLLRGSGASFGLKLAASGATFLITLLLARLLGADGLGIYSYAIAWATLLAVPALLGMDLLMVRSVAAESTRQNWSEIRGLLTFTRASVLLGSMTIALAAAALALSFNPALDLQARAFLAAMPLVPLTALIRLNQGAMRGLHRVVSGQLAELLARPVLTLLLIVVAFLLLGPTFDALWATGLHVLSAAVALALGILLLRRALPPAVRSAKPVMRPRHWLSVSLPLLLVGGLQVVNRQVDIVMVGSIAGPEPTGIYTTAARGAEVIGFVLFAVNASLAPVIAGLHASGQQDRLQRTVTRAARGAFVAAAPLTIGFIVFGDFFLSLFGPEFRAGHAALAVLSLAQLFNAAAGSVAAILTMTGHERLTASGSAIAVGLNVLLNVLLIPPFGIVGAATASGISLVAWNAILITMLARRLGIDPTILGYYRRSTA